MLCFLKKEMKGRSSILTMEVALRSRVLIQRCTDVLQIRGLAGERLSRCQEQLGVN